MGTEQEKSTLQVRLIRRVTFYGRIEVPLPGFFFFWFTKKRNKPDVR